MKVKRTQSLSHSWKTLSKLNLTTTFKRTLIPRKSLTPDLSHLSKEQVFSSDGFDICLGYLAYELDLKQNGQKLCIYTLQGSKKLLEGVITPLERLSTTGGCIDIDLYIYICIKVEKDLPLFFAFFLNWKKMWTIRLEYEKTIRYSHTSRRIYKSSMNRDLF